MWSKDDRHKVEHGRFDMSEEGGITVITAGWMGVMVVRHYDQHGRLDGSEDVPAYQSARSLEGSEEGTA